MAKIKGVSISSPKDEKVISDELEGSYGKSIVIMSSNINELDMLCSLLGDRYEVVMDTEVLDNHDYAKVIIRK